MTYDYQQARKNGELFFGPQPEGPKKEEIISILQSGLTSNGWQLTEAYTNSQPYQFNIKASNNNLEIYIYCWRISNGGRKNRPYEQRIQIGKADNKGFEINNYDGTARGLLLGIYCSEEPGTEPIIVAWETEKNKDHGASKSCFIGIEAIAMAMRDGFIQTRDTDGNLICAFRKEFLNFYIMNLKKLHTISFSEITVSGEQELSISIPVEKREISGGPNIHKGINRIIYGAPGTGKSYLLEQEYSTNYNRVTFHPEYSYHDFVGSLRPKKSDDGNITYEFSPGPFSIILKNALVDNRNLYTLIIEEINRANTAAVFGDVFQLLDRNEFGESEYAIRNDDLLNYLNKDSGLNIQEIKIPSNLNIVATMNSADQGVFIMDSAFKRRWQFDYLKINFEGVEHANFLVPYAGQEITWRHFAESINEKLADIEINEDKHIGPYFMKREEVCDKDKIASKLLIYLWDDVVRHNRSDLFNTEKYKTFADVSEAYKNGEAIFTDGVINLNTPHMGETDE